LIRRLALGLLLLPLLFVFGCAGDLPQGAIAQVGAQLVTQDQFDALRAMYEAAARAPDKDEQPEEYKSFEQGLAEYLVIQQVLRQKASGFGVNVTQQDVQSRLQQIRQMFPDDAKFADALESQGMTLEELTQSIEESLWLEAMKEAVTSDVAVSEEEAKAYYEAHKGEYVQQESREVRHILISPFPTAADGTVSTTATQAEWDAAMSEAEKVRSEIQNGTDFVTEAERYSDDDATKDSGGELGAVTRGVMVPAFEEAMFNLQKGELSEPTKTQYGYHLIEVTDITPEKQLSYDQVKENIKSALLEAGQTERWQEWLAQAETDLGVKYRSGYKPTSTPDSSADENTTGSKDE
jgi:foldase protein PrsA